MDTGAIRRRESRSPRACSGATYPAPAGFTAPNQRPLMPNSGRWLAQRLDVDPGAWCRRFRCRARPRTGDRRSTPADHDRGQVQPRQVRGKQIAQQEGRLDRLRPGAQGEPDRLRPGPRPAPLRPVPLAAGGLIEQPLPSPRDRVQAGRWRRPEQTPHRVWRTHTGYAASSSAPGPSPCLQLERRQMDPIEVAYVSVSATGDRHRPPTARIAQPAPTPTGTPPDRKALRAGPVDRTYSQPGHHLQARALGHGLREPGLTNLLGGRSSATLTCSGAASALVSIVFFEYFLVTAVHCLWVVFGGRPTPTAWQASGGDRHRKSYETRDNLGAKPP